MSDDSELTGSPNTDPRLQSGEPSVLDWVKSLLRGNPLPIPEVEGPRSEPPQSPHSQTERATAREPAERWTFRAAQFRVPLALLLALLAQFGLEQRSGSIGVSAVFYGLSVLMVGWAAWAGDFPLRHNALLPVRLSPLRVRLPFLVIALFAFALTVLSAGDNRFDPVTSSAWILATGAVIYAFWEGELPHKKLLTRVKSLLIKRDFDLHLDAWSGVVLLAICVSVFFRIYRLSEVPAEMVSDHAEKLLDVVDILNGQRSIFFPRNTGREALQFYMAVLTIKIFGTGIGHLTLKIGTVAAGLLTLPYIYLLGREAADRKTGLFAMLLAGIAYWPNVISRVGLRFPLFPLFVAPAMYHLVKAIRRRSFNDFLLVGFFVGAGLHGYSPARVIPILVVIGILLYLLHRDSSGQRLNLLGSLVVTGLVALVIVAPLARVAIDQPDIVIYRMATRIGTTERSLPGSAVVIFLKNVWNALKMFAWDNGEVWVISIPGRPALDWVSGALFHLGVALAAVRYVRKRRWVDLFILVSIPILQLPSTLSLAFPAENPATNRAAGAIVPVFYLAGLTLSVLIDWMRTQWRTKSAMIYASAVVTLLIIVSARINYDLVFRQYDELFRRSAWNTSEAGRVIRGFASSIGDYDDAYVVAFPHWMDTRLVGMNAGQATKDYAIQPDELQTLLEKTSNQLLLLHPDDHDSLSLLEMMFPSGQTFEWSNPLPGKNFTIYFVPSIQARHDRSQSEPEF